MDFHSNNLNIHKQGDFTIYDLDYFDVPSFVEL